MCTRVIHGTRDYEVHKFVQPSNLTRNYIVSRPASVPDYLCESTDEERTDDERRRKIICLSRDWGKKNEHRESVGFLLESVNEIRGTE